MNPIEELLKGMRSQEHPASERRETWRDRMSAAVDELDSCDTAMLIICRGGRTRVVKSTNGESREILDRAKNVCYKKNIK